MPVVFQIRTGDKIIPVSTNGSGSSLINNAFDINSLFVTFNNQFTIAETSRIRGIFFRDDGKNYF